MEKRNFTTLFIITILAAFLGSYVASLVIFGGLKNKPSSPDYLSKMEQQFPQEFDKFVDEIENAIKTQSRKFKDRENELSDNDELLLPPARFVQINNIGLKVQETKDSYKIVFDLRPFNKDEKNVTVGIDEDKLNISAQYKSKDKNGFNSAQFYQTIELPTDIDPNYIEKKKEGDNLIITLHKKAEN